MAYRLVILFALLGLTVAAKFSVPLRKSATNAELGLRRLQSEAKTGQQVLHDTWDEYYLADISVGTPPQPLAVAIDTTYSDVWILDVDCKTPNCHIGPDGRIKQTYNSSASSTFVQGYQNFVVGFGSDWIYGVRGEDTLQMAGFTIANQDIGQANDFPSVFPLTPVEGVLGLGWQEKASGQTTSPMKNLLSQLDQPLITIWYERAGNKTKECGGRITYGGLDEMACAADINYVPLAEKALWGFNVDRFTMGTYQIVDTRRARSATGSSYTGVPSAVLNHIIKVTKAKYNWDYRTYTVACSTAQTGLPITLTIGGQPYAIQPTDYVLDLNLSNNQCAIGFYTATAAFGEEIWVLGEALMRNYCHVYDFGNARVGLAKIVGN